jgi:hypothetical protein
MPWVTLVRCYCECFPLPGTSPVVEIRKYELRLDFWKHVTNLSRIHGYSVGSVVYLDRNGRRHTTVIAVGDELVWRQHPAFGPLTC